MRSPAALAGLLRRAVALARSPTPSFSASASAAAPIDARLAAASLHTGRGFAASTSTSGRAVHWGSLSGGFPAAARSLATRTSPLPATPLSDANPVAALKARLMPATGRNQFRRKWKKQAEIKVRRRKGLGCCALVCMCVPAPCLSHPTLCLLSIHTQANHRRRLHQEVMARARKASERKTRWAAAAARAATAVEAGGGAAAVV